MTAANNNIYKMSKVLVIRHLPQNLSFQDKERLLKHFGAEKVWETSSKRHYIFASFENVKKAKEALTRLHQQEIAQRRLVVEYSKENEPSTKNQQNTEQSSNATKLINEFLKVLNAWNPSVEFFQPPPPHLKYKYPEINPDIALNIIHSLYTHKPLYIQVVHLLNKMCIDIPFTVNDTAVKFFKENFSAFFTHIPPPPPEPESVPESEISSDEPDISSNKQQPTPLIVKRKKKLPIPSRKRPAPSLPKPQKNKKANVSKDVVFETGISIQEPKKIALVVHQDALQKVKEEPDVIGELGTFEKEQKQPQNAEKVETDLPTISRKELLKNRLSQHDMKLLTVYKNYHPGQPSMRLYIKNLAKSVTEQDVKRIYKMYVEGCIDEEQTGFDVRVMQEGRMKGQAFVTFPSIKIAEVAMNETNGYLLKEKPMVVQFARAANKKTLE